MMDLEGYVIMIVKNLAGNIRLFGNLITFTQYIFIKIIRHQGLNALELVFHHPKIKNVQK